MPHPSKTSTCAKAQQLNGSQYFTTAEHSDSALEHSTSAEPDSDVLSSEVEEPAMLPGPTLPLKSQKCKLKSAYTGDSKRNKFCKQNYWQTAEQGCQTLSDWVQLSIIKFSGGFKLTKNQVTKQPNL